jgi:hypothetical protein
MFFDEKSLRFVHRSDPRQGKVVVYSDTSKSLVVCDIKDSSPRRTFRAPVQTRAERCPLCHSFVNSSDFPTPMHGRSSSSRYMHPQYFSTLADIHQSDPPTETTNEHHRRESFQFPIDESDESNGKRPEEEDGTFPSSFITGYYQRFFREMKKLGTGSFGSVFLCQHFLHGVDLGTYAVKKIVLSDDPTWQERVFREVRLLERVHHPNIVAYRHTWLEYAKIADFGPTSPCLFLLMEFANAGNLDDYLEMANQHPLDEADIWKLFVDILQGLRHLHHAGVVHRDIKVSHLHLFVGLTEFSLQTYCYQENSILFLEVNSPAYSFQTLGSVKACCGIKDFLEQALLALCFTLPQNCFTKMENLIIHVIFIPWVLSFMLCALVLHLISTWSISLTTNCT